MTKTSGRPVTPVGIAAEILERLVEESHGETCDATSERFRRNLKHASRIVGGLEEYVERHTSQPSDRLMRLADRTRRHDWMSSFEAGETELKLEQEMLSGHAEGEFLKTLVSITNAKSVLEIGMFTGYGTLAMAEALPNDGRVVALEYDKFVADFARQSFAEAGVDDKIRVIVGPAESSLQTLIDEKATFDFVFLDADKAGYRGYLETLLESKLLGDGALICVDNTLLQGEPYLDDDASESGRAIAAFNEFVSSRSDLHHVLVPLRDGVTLIRRNMETT